MNCGRFAQKNSVPNTRIGKFLKLEITGMAFGKMWRWTLTMIEAHLFTAIFEPCLPSTIFVLVLLSSADNFKSNIIQNMKRCAIKAFKLSSQRNYKVFVSRTSFSLAVQIIVLQETCTIIVQNATKILSKLSSFKAKLWRHLQFNNLKIIQAKLSFPRKLGK